MSNMKQLFAYVPSNVISDFTSKHIGEDKANDNYFSKVSFLGNGQIATRGRLFGMTDSEISQVGLSSLPTGKSSIGAYLVELAGKYDTLNGDLTTSVKSYVGSYVGEAIASVVANAPSELDTLKEIADLLQNTSGSGVQSFVNIQGQVGTRPANTGNGGQTTWAGNLYDYASYIADYKISTLDVTDTAEAGKYISQITETDGKISVTRASLPTLSIATGSATYLSVNNHEIGVTTSSISSTTGFTYTSTPAEGHTSYELNTAESIGTGLVTASDVYSRLRADETFVASALSTMDTRIKDVVNNTVGGLDKTLTLTDAGSYITTTVVQQDGKLTDSGSSITFDYAKIYAELDSSITLNATENGTSYASVTIVEENGVLTSTGSSLTINRNNILAKTETTVSSPITGSGANEYIKVNVVTENHDVKSVTVVFDPWEVYTPSQQGE